MSTTVEVNWLKIAAIFVGPRSFEFFVTHSKSAPLRGMGSQGWECRFTIRRSRKHDRFRGLRNLVRRPRKLLYTL